MDILEKIIKTSGNECNRYIKKSLKEIKEPDLLTFLNKKYKEIIASKREDEQAQRRLEIKKTLKEYLRTNEIKSYIRLCKSNAYIEI
jgi:adenylate kinase